ncbi:hypothetical protein PSZ99_23655, partial [Shigella sonnei]|nr:hypothetical protein [Shigella sonnei]
WDIVKLVVKEATSQSFLAKSLPDQFNCTFIALIPKVDTPEHASQFRPIALCNFAYKILKSGYP